VTPFSPLIVKGKSKPEEKICFRTEDMIVQSIITPVKKVSSPMNQFILPDLQCRRNAEPLDEYEKESMCMTPRIHNHPRL
jgi:hypothetical protein